MALTTRRDTESILTCECQMKVLGSSNIITVGMVSPFRVEHTLRGHAFVDSTVISLSTGAVERGLQASFLQNTNQGNRYKL